MPQTLGHGLRLFIENELYDDSFNNVAEMRRWFIRSPKHLKGNELEHNTPILQTVIAETFGKEDTHHVLSQEDGKGPYLVIGPSAVLRNKLFEIGSNATDYAISEATKYDLL